MQRSTTLTQWLRPALLCILGATALLPPRAQGAFIREYALSQFTFININADGPFPAGTFLTPDGGLTAVLTGGSNGSYMPGTSTAYIKAAGAGEVRFDYFYDSLDWPGYDRAQYLLGNTVFFLADTAGAYGSVSFQVSAGQAFAFRVETLDNTVEPGVLTISNFEAPAAVPEPSTLYFVCGALALGLARGARRCQWRRPRGDRQ